MQGQVDPVVKGIHSALVLTLTLILVLALAATGDGAGTTMIPVYILSTPCGGVYMTKIGKEARDGKGGGGGTAPATWAHNQTAGH